MSTQTRSSLSWLRRWRGLLILTVAAAVPIALLGQTSRDTAGEESGLNDFLVRKRAALTRQQPTGEVAAQALHARVTAESRSGVRRLRIRDFQVLSDSERSLAGYNLGAGSWDTEVAVLGSAVADEFVIQAAAKGIRLDALDVVFTSRPDDPSALTGTTGRVSYPRNFRYTAYIESPASDAELEELRRLVEEVNPVIHLATRSQHIAPGKLEYRQTPATPEPGAAPGLRDFLVEKRAALLRRQNAPRPARAREQAAAANAEGLRSHIAVEGCTGLRRLRIGDHAFQVIHDSPRALGGHDLGPTVEEHQLGVMATCLTHIFEIQAALREVRLDSLEVSVDATLTPRIGAGTTNPPRYQNIQYTVHIGSPDSAEKVDELRKAVEAVCPIYNLLKDEQTLEGKIVRERYRGA